MPTDAGEVRIRLAADAIAFKKSLNAALAEIKAFKAEAKGISPSIRRATRSTKGLTRGINRANTSVTLLVAKFALLVFAVQTVANILDSTFGSALRNIDDFQQNVIGTAAAITNLADLKAVPGSTFADAFAQNLSFVTDAFKELELISGNFFSSAIDLQLTFNTLANRGVVIRREEFNILGLVTDQIKSLTRGQATSKQIAQEVRNLFTGQVRASDALAQFIRAQGGNVKKIAEELRRTGSLKPLEPFLRGLKEAQGLFRGLLTPAIERFKAILNQISRSGFIDVFEGVVGAINDINDSLSENKGLVAGIANLVVNRLSAAFKQLLVITSSLGSILIDLSTNLVPLLAVSAGLLVKRFGVITSLITAATVGIATQREGVGVLSQSFEFLAGTLRAGILVILKAIDIVIRGLADPVTLLKLIFNDLFKRLVINLKEVFVVLSALPGPLQFFAKTGVRVFDKLLATLGKEKITLKAELGKNTKGKDLTTVLKELNKEVNDFNKRNSGGIKLVGDDEVSKIKDLARFLGSSEEDIKRSIEARAKAIKQGNRNPFPTLPGGPIADKSRTADLLRRILEAQRKLRDAESKRDLSQSLRNIEIERSAIDNAVANELTTHRQAFIERRKLDEQEKDLRLASIDEQFNAQKKLFEEQKKRILSDDKINKNEKLQQIELLRLKIFTKIVNLQEKNVKVNGKYTSELDKQNTKLDRQRIEVKRILESRKRDVGSKFVSTLDDRLTKLKADQATARRSLEKRPGTTKSQLATSDKLDEKQVIQELIKTPLTAVLSSIEDAFNSLIDGLVQGSLDFKQVAQSISSTLIKGGLKDAIDGLKKAISKGLQKIFTKLGTEAAGQAAQALAVGIGLLLAVLSKTGSDASFTPGGGSSGGSIVDSTRQVRGIIGGDSSIAIAEINNGLSEALIPTNNILASIERNTRSLAELNLNIDPDQLSQSIQSTIQNILNEALLQVNT